jgi:hypothetical protein
VSTHSKAPTLRAPVQSGFAFAPTDGTTDVPGKGRDSGVTRPHRFSRLSYGAGNIVVPLRAERGTEGFRRLLPARELEERRTQRVRLLPRTSRERVVG